MLCPYSYLNHLLVFMKMKMLERAVNMATARAKQVGIEATSKIPTWGVHSSCSNIFGFNFCVKELRGLGIANLVKWPGAVCDVLVIGPNTALPEGIDAQQLTVSSSFILEVIKERFSGKIPSAESFPFVEPELVETSSIDCVSTMMASPPAKKSRTEVRNLPGVLDAGAGNLVTFAGPEVNRRIARHFAREFGLRYSSSRRGAFTLLKQTKQILELVEPITSGASVASHCAGFGPGGISIID